MAANRIYRHAIYAIGSYDAQVNVDHRVRFNLPDYRLLVILDRQSKYFDLVTEACYNSSRTCVVKRFKWYPCLNRGSTVLGRDSRHLYKMPLGQ